MIAVTPQLHAIIPHGWSCIALMEPDATPRHWMVLPFTKPARCNACSKPSKTAATVLLRMPLIAGVAGGGKRATRNYRQLFDQNAINIEDALPNVSGVRYGLISKAVPLMRFTRRCLERFSD